MKKRLLLVEDETKLRDQLLELLGRHNFDVDVCSDGAQAVSVIGDSHYDIAVVDLGLPKVSGIDVIKAIRSSGAEYPILILTARSDWQDKVQGLEAGADDYLVKPFHIQEFLARLEALIRRATGQFKPSLEAGPIHLDTRKKRVCVSGEGVDLTAYEFNLLQYLMHRPGEVISKSELTDHLYEQDYDKDSNVIEVFIGRLRKKLDPENALNPIETVRGLGYRFELAIS
ncbi:MAG: response regulator transcription factor [Pseudomonadales bacterium]|jgi:two-component system response regulator PhoP|nr:response regulator transcription factor [Pseudomonadales bacterium]MDG1441996.1 response regulator transcription factor [Pseudomonadales bacterium]